MATLSEPNVVFPDGENDDNEVNTPTAENATPSTSKKKKKKKKKPKAANIQAEGLAKERGEDAPVVKKKKKKKKTNSQKTKRNDKQTRLEDDNAPGSQDSTENSDSSPHAPVEETPAAVNADISEEKTESLSLRRQSTAKTNNLRQSSKKQPAEQVGQPSAPVKSILKKKADTTSGSKSARLSLRKTVTLFRPQKVQIQKKKKEKGLHVLVCSANLGNAEPSLTDIASWIPSQGRCASVTPLPHITKFKKESFDVVAVGMQESTWSNRKVKKLDSNVSSFDTSDNDTELADPDPSDRGNRDLSKLAMLIEDTLGLRYELLAEKSRGQMRLVIFVRREIHQQFTDLTIRCENTGVAHVMANKGGIVISFMYQKTRISFLSAHLAAHEGDGHYAARCDSLLEIFGGTHAHERYDAALASHHCFVLGDLNFRVRLSEGDGSEHGEDTKASVRKALELIREEDFETLYQHDELQTGIKKGHLLVDFETLPCHFSPTFKVQREPGFVYKEQRTPSYTDRILYRSANRGFLKPLAYEPIPDFSTSDHKPIRGAFSIMPNAAVPKPGPTCSYKLKFRKMSCQDLPNVDVIGKSDPYIMLVWKHVNMNANTKDKGLMKWTSPRNSKWPKTKYIANTLDPVFTGQELDLTFNGPVGAEAILYVSVLDYDMQSKDDLIGTLPINLRQLAGKLAPHQIKKTVSLDQPLTKYARHFGRIKMVIDIERFNTRVLSIRNDGQPGFLQRLVLGK